MRKSASLRSWGLGLLSAALLCTPSAGAEPPPRHHDIATVPIEELLDLETVTPSVEAQTVLDAPSAVFVVTEDVIRRRGYRSLEELLDDIPGVEIQHKSHVEYWNLFTLRGIYGNAKFVVLLDGFRINAISGTPHSYGPNFSLINARRVEVVLGPVSAVYGPDAFSGVVNIITHQGSELEGGSVTASYGRFDTTDDSFVFGTSIGEVKLALAGSLYASGEPELPRYYRDEYAWYFDRYLPEGKARLSPFAPEGAVMDVPVERYTAPSLGHFVHGRMDVGAFRFAYVHHGHTFSSSTAGMPEFNLAVADALWSYRIQSASALHDYRNASGRLQLSSSLSLSSYELSPRSQFVNSFSAYGGYKYERWLGVLAEQRLKYRFADWLSGGVGVSFAELAGQPKSPDLQRPFDPNESPDVQDHSYVGSEVVDQLGRDLRVPLGFNNLRNQNLGSYAELRAHPLDFLSATLGTRFDYNTRYGKSLSPRAGITLRPLERTAVKLLYGSAFLAPAPYEAYQHFGSFAPALDEQGNVIGLRSDFWFLPNPDLKPERSHTFEVGVSRWFGNELLVSASGYWTELRGLIVSVDSTERTFKGWPASRVSRHVNQQRGSTYGGALQLTGDLRLKALRLSPNASLALSDGEIGGVPPSLTASQVLRLGLDLSWQRISLSTRVQLRSSALHPFRNPDGSRAEVPGSAMDTVYLRAGRIFERGQIALTPWLKATNLLDRRYGHVTVGPDQFRAAPQDPFRLLIGVDAEAF